MFLISYDIENDYLRTKLAKLLIRFGLQRVQYSVFMGVVANEAMKRLHKALARLCKEAHWQEAEDSIMILPLHQYSRKHVNFLGKKTSHWEEISGKMHTLVL